MDSVLENLATLFVLASALGGLWFRIERRAYGIDRDLQDYKLEIAKNYAPITYVKDVEGRIVQRLDTLITEIHDLRKELVRELTKR